MIVAVTIPDALTLLGSKSPENLVAVTIPVTTTLLFSSNLIFPSVVLIPIVVIPEVLPSIFTRISPDELVIFTFSSSVGLAGIDWAQYCLYEGCSFL